MRFNPLVLGTIATGAAITTMATATHVQAAQLLSWDFNSSQNQLTFYTSSGVQPKAMLIQNPTRLVVDLPGVDLGRQTMRRSVGGVIRSVRAGQFNNNTARLVVELAPGYTLNPQEIRFVGRASNQWSVQLPQPTRITGTPTASPSVRGPVQVTQNGLYLPFSGRKPSVNVTRSSDRRQIFVLLSGMTLPETGRQIINHYGISSLDLTQVNSNAARITLNVDENAPNWAVSASERGVVFVPDGGMRVLRDNNPIQPATLADRVAIPVPPPQSSSPAPTPNPSPSRPPVRNSRVLVMIDPGHGGRDPGAIGIGGLREKDVVLPISQQVVRILEQNGVQTMMTRSDDRFVSLQGRTVMANRADADVFVSIHANAVGGGRSSVNGAETFYFSTGYRLAREIQSSIIRKTGMNNRGVKRARFYVLRYTDMPAALAEVGFVTGRYDSAKLANPAFRSTMAEAIAEGILNYLR